MKATVKNKHFRLYLGDNLRVLSNLKDNSVDSVVCDPPYGLGKEPDPYEMIKQWYKTGHYNHKNKSGFMNQEWDSFVPQPLLWREVFRVLKPGGHLISFFGTRTYDIGVLALRLAGFEIRDQIAWVYGNGFPKSQNISKSVDSLISSGKSDSKAIKEVNRTRPGKPKVRKSTTNGHKGFVGSNSEGSSEKRDTPKTKEGMTWYGFGTALKPAQEPIVICRKPLSEKTVAKNVLAHNTGALNIDACRIPLNGDYKCKANGRPSQTGLPDNYDPKNANKADTVGRFPSNLIHDGSKEVLDLFPTSKGQVGRITGKEKSKKTSNVFGEFKSRNSSEVRGDQGSAARFFYCAKVSKSERNYGLADLKDKVIKESNTNVIGLKNNINTSSGKKRNANLITKNHHPTVKPVNLMRYLCKLITPPNGVVLDPFMGSGSTGIAAVKENFRFIGIEINEDYFEISEKRINRAVEDHNAQKESENLNNSRKTLFR